MQQHPGLIFAPDLSRRINYTMGRWFDGLGDISWPQGLYVGCLGYLIITAFMIAIWIAGFVAGIAIWAFLMFHVWAFQIAVIIVAMPFAVAYALYQRR
jgi:hypothetical protein